jgi:alpha-glucosidase
MQELRSLIDEYPGDRVLIAEDEDVAYHGSGNNELHMVFNFPLLRTARLTPAHIRSNQETRLAELPPGAWPCNTLGNHDSPRMWSRYGDGIHNAALARLHLVLMLTLKGTPVLFNGEEIGMADLELTDLSQFRDTAAIGQYRRLTERFGKSPAEALQAVVATTRDRCRSPLQWDNSPNAGFSPPEVQPWLPANANYMQGVNVADQMGDPTSMLSFYRRMLAVRRSNPALMLGEYQALDPAHAEVLAFLRQDTDSGQTCVVLLNFSEHEQHATFNIQLEHARLLFTSTSRDDLLTTNDGLTLAPFEIVIVELS